MVLSLLGNREGLTLPPPLPPPPPTYTAIDRVGGGSGVSPSIQRDKVTSTGNATQRGGGVKIGGTGRSDDGERIKLSDGKG